MAEPLSYVRGPQNPYKGSETARWTVDQSIKARKTDKPVLDALRACMDALWLTEPDSNLRGFINKRTISRRTGMNMDGITPHSGRNKSGVQDHRLCDVRTGRGAQATWLASYSTCSTWATDTLAELCRANDHSVAVFQAWAVVPIAVETFWSSNKKKSEAPKNYKVMIEPACGAVDLPKQESQRCWKRAHPGTYETGQVKATKMQSCKSRFVYAPAADIKSASLGIVTVPTPTCRVVGVEGHGSDAMHVSVAARLYEVGRMKEGISVYGCKRKNHHGGGHHGCVWASHMRAAKGSSDASSS